MLLLHFEKMETILQRDFIKPQYFKIFWWEI